MVERWRFCRHDLVPMMLRSRAARQVHRVLRYGCCHLAEANRGGFLAWSTASQRSNGRPMARNSSS
jgi:hypothetical protein